jgi:hypothetical protein
VLPECRLRSITKFRVKSQIFGIASLGSVLPCEGSPGNRLEGTQKD